MELKDTVKSVLHFITVELDQPKALDKERVSAELRRISGKPMLDMVAVYEVFPIITNLKEFNEFNVNLIRVWSDDIEFKTLPFVVTGYQHEKAFQLGKLCGIVMSGIDKASRPVSRKDVDDRTIIDFEATQEQKQAFVELLKRVTTKH